MNAIAPIKSALIDASLVNDGGDNILYLGQAAQKLTLRLRDMTTKGITFPTSSKIKIAFRPGTIKSPKTSIKVSGTAWKSTLLGTHIVTLSVSPKAAVSLQEFDTLDINLTGLTPESVGGSRATRVQVEISGMQVGGQTLPRPITSTERLSLVHSGAPLSQSQGAIAATGPIKADILTSSDVLIGQASVLKLHFDATEVLDFSANLEGPSKLVFKFPKSAGGSLMIKGATSLLKKIKTVKILKGHPIPGDDLDWTFRIHNRSKETVLIQEKLYQKKLSTYRKGTIDRTTSEKGLLPPGKVMKVTSKTGPIFVISSQDGKYHYQALDTNLINKPGSFGGMGSFNPDPVFSGSKLDVKLTGNRNILEIDAKGAAPKKGKFLGVTLQITSNLKPGLYPLEVMYENLAGKSGKLEFLLPVTALGVKGQTPKRLSASFPVDVHVLTVSESLTCSDRFRGNKVFVKDFIELVGVNSNSGLWMGPRDKASWKVFGDSRQFYIADRTGKDPGSGFAITPRAKAINWWTNSKKPLRIFNSGGDLSLGYKHNVGIGIDKPEAKLHVAGDLKTNAIEVLDKAGSKSKGAKVDYEPKAVGSKSALVFTVDGRKVAAMSSDAMYLNTETNKARTPVWKPVKT